MSALPSRSAIAAMLFADETATVRALSAEAALTPEDQRRVAELARQLVAAVRAGRRQQGGIDAFMQEYSLSSQEGVVLMCLAEALLRIPDADTADRLIADKLGGKDWERHLGQSDSLFVNASAWGLMLTGRFVDLGRIAGSDAPSFLRRLVTRSGEPIVRNAMKQAMRIMGKQFVLGRTIGEALAVAAPLEAEGYRFSYDMLGEAAFTSADADRYFESYRNALASVGRNSKGADIFARASISVKLSALHPRYEEKQEARVMAELLPRVASLAAEARALDVGLTVDAEEVNRLDLSLELFGRLCQDPRLQGWNGLGLAVQAYAKRARPTLQWLGEVAAATGRVWPVRLVKGAYWDTEIKRAQEQGFTGYPLFTRKVSTDVSYLACARYLLSRRDVFYPQFATHNAHSLAAVSVLAGNDRRFEFQRLHGMGQALYEQVVGKDRMNQPCRIYAPVGSHEDLLAYLVRRLLENGANSSFVNQIVNEDVTPEQVAACPLTAMERIDPVASPALPAGPALFDPRRNSRGFDLTDAADLALIEQARAPHRDRRFDARPRLAGPVAGGLRRAVHNPATGAIVGHVLPAATPDVQSALQTALPWDAAPSERAEILNRASMADIQMSFPIFALLAREAGKTLADAVGELREAVDFLRYYAQQATALTAPARGIFACISPWNFPLAIFTGQIAAALATGNAVLAKPAEQTPLIATLAVDLLLKTGVPVTALQLLPGDGTVGAALTRDPRVAGVAFTGSTATALKIRAAMAEHLHAGDALIAETGGLNAMLVDSTALPEQAVRDILASAFQ